VEEIKRASIKLKIYGEEFDLRKPNLKEAIDYQKKLQGMNEDSDASEQMLEMLESCGLPKDFALSMEPDHVLLVMEKLVPPKKK